VLGFQKKEAAERFLIAMRERLAKFGLSSSVITLKPATCGQFKTGHSGWPET
jgi:hypothetical protein